VHLAKDITGPLTDLPGASRAIMALREALPGADVGAIAAANPGLLHPQRCDRVAEVRRASWLVAAVWRSRTRTYHVVTSSPCSMVCYATTRRQKADGTMRHVYHVYHASMFMLARAAGRQCMPGCDVPVGAVNL
jgi:hypothetical protein